MPNSVVGKPLSSSPGNGAAGGAVSSVVTLKAALTLDGRMATRTGDSKWITSERARTMAHRLRARVDAVLVGVGTAIADDPELTVRLCRGSNPLRVVLDSRARLPVRSKLVEGAADVETLLLHGSGADERALDQLRERHVQTVSVRRLRGGGLSPSAVLRALAKRDVYRVLLEGGPTVHGSFLKAGLVDDVALFYAPKLLGDSQAMPLCFGPKRTHMAMADVLETPQLTRLGVDWLITGQLQTKSRKPGLSP